MKRSEAIQKLGEYLLHTVPDNYEQFTDPLLNAKTDAECNIEFMESLGMQPPTITVLPNSYNRSEGTYGFESNEWEPENET